MKNELPTNEDLNKKEPLESKQLIEHLQDDTAVDLEKVKTESTGPIPDRINGVEAPWAVPLKRSKKPLIALTAIVVLVAGIAAWYFLVFLPSQAKDDKEATTATQFESTKALVGQISPDLKGSSVSIREATGVSAVDSEGNYVYGAPVYKPNGFAYGSLPLEVEGVAYVGNSDVSSKNYELLKRFFEDNNFTKRFSTANVPGYISDTDDAVNYIAYAEYESNKFLCSVYHADATSISLKGHVVSMGCADKASYVQAAKGLQPIYEAYRKGEKDVSDKLVFGFVREKSGADGFKYAVIYQEDENVSFVGREDSPAALTGLYYQAPGQSDWTYFMITPVDSQPSCASYNSDVLKKAFSGHQCYDEAAKKDSTVK